MEKGSHAFKENPKNHNVKIYINGQIKLRSRLMFQFLTWISSWRWSLGRNSTA